MSSKKKGKPHLSSGSGASLESEGSAQSTAGDERHGPPARNWLIPAARVLLAVAAVLAGYLAWNSLSGGSLPGCGPASACDKVLQSRWAYWLGIPVSLPALLAYLALIMETFTVRGKASVEQQRRAWLLIVGVSVLVIGAALWFIGLQVFVLKSFCKFCMTAHASGLIASILLLCSAPFASARTASKRSEVLAIPGRLGLGLAVLGGLAWMVLAGGQVLVDRPAPRVKTALQAGINEPLQPRVLPADERPAVPRTASDAAVGEPAPIAPATVTTITPPPTAPAAAPAPAVEVPKPPGRELRLHGGKFQLRLGELPLIGSAQASNVIVSLFDYTCHYCRDLHGLLAEAQKRFSNQLAIVSVPMPLDGSCNHLVARTQAAHQQACQYAALGLAVWRAQPESFQQFDTWLFTPSPPPSVGAVKSYADGLVGRQKLEQALTDGWVANQIQAGISIYEANTRQLNNDGRMPQLIIGATVNAGPIDRIEELYRLLSDHLGLKSNP